MYHIVTFNGFLGGDPVLMDSLLIITEEDLENEEYFLDGVKMVMYIHGREIIHGILKNTEILWLNR